MKDLITFLEGLDGDAVKDLIGNFLLQFIIPNALLTLFITQIIKKILQFLRQKYKLTWIRNWFYPVIALFSGIVIVAISLLAFLKTPSIWLILTFGLLIGLLACGLFDHLEILIVNKKFHIDFWNWIWKKIGLDELVMYEPKDEQKQIEAEWKKLNAFQEELQKRKAELDVRSEVLNRREKVLQDLSEKLNHREDALRAAEQELIKKNNNN